MTQRWKRRFDYAAAAVFAVLILNLAAVVLLPLLFLPSLRQPVSASPDQAGLSFEPVQLALDQGALPGWWLPADAPVGTVVIVHDGASNRSLIWEGGMAFAARLHGENYAVLLFDLPGHGEAPDAPATPTGANIAEAAAAAVDHARARLPDVPVFLHGFGLGGVTAIYAAASGTQVTALSVDSVWADLKESLSRTIPDVTPVPGILLAPSLDVAETIYGIDYAGSRPIDVVTDVDAPLLVVRNAADRQVLAAHSKQLAERARDGTLWVTPAPPASHPIYRDRGSWGTHTQSFNLDPDRYITTLTDFYKSAERTR